MAQLTCFHCQKEVPLMGNVGRRDDCPFCHADLHVCKNCTHYDTTAYNECREPQADRVVEKERSNFCDFFSPGSARTAAGKKDDLASAAEALFKKSE